MSINTYIGQIVNFYMAGFNGPVAAMIIAVVDEDGLRCNLKLFPSREQIQSCYEAERDDAVRLLKGGEAYDVPYNLCLPVEWGFDIQTSWSLPEITVRNAPPSISGKPYQEELAN